MEHEILNRVRDAIINLDEENLKKACMDALESGVSAYTVVTEGMAKGMAVVGKKYEEKEYFVPELLLCADALYAGLDILKPHIKPEDVGERAKGQVVIGTVQGDVHDIGKNIIKMMFEVAGFTVHDLGRDVPLEKFVEEQIRTDSDIVALSAMMTTTMMSMKKVIEMIKEKNPNVAIMLGGAPVTRDITELFGADGYADSAGNTVQEAIKMIGRLRKMQER